MILIPAIDLKDGRCVRLVQGDFERSTVYGEDPAETARGWERAGAQLIHLVDLDASAGTEGANTAAVEAIRAAVSCPLELGGGIKSLEAVEYWMERDIDRLIMGTAVSERPAIVRDACERYPGRIAAALDSRGGILKTWGWLRDGGKDLLETAASLKALGVSLVIHTDVERDGTQLGPNIALAAEVARVSGLPTVVSGGISGEGDVRAVKAAAPELYGIITGKALYAGTLDFGRGRTILESLN
ncbi:MAG: 1-(5-phosphoribosyl)-5-[(5-phosphoribosylamino)methylideneamino] imidazole-4-carboxamide isomerase [Deltaproteobacteria bacterium]|jgi:phosphoribosylformimino-5-aminoimidazole carboxamide ribotide isomerase|nr:1-(5-phosphoribosyl)-5-[(5-phosphoribosylamino)methylideneamino] imidazole-4-carboxamide isomerase [Deltaproteobacteria bacterium]